MRCTCLLLTQSGHWLPLPISQSKPIDDRETSFCSRLYQLEGRTMPQPNRFDPSRLPPIARRRCPSCEMLLFLSRIEPTDRVDYEERTTHCRFATWNYSRFPALAPGGIAKANVS